MKNITLVIIAAALGLWLLKSAKDSPGEMSNFEQVLAKTHRFDGQDFKPSPVIGSQEYFLLYFSASW